MISRLFRWTFPAITYRWCVVAPAVGCGPAIVNLVKCKNGNPIGHGFFLIYVVCEDYDSAKSLAAYLNHPVTDC